MTSPPEEKTAGHKEPAAQEKVSDKAYQDGRESTVKTDALPGVAALSRRAEDAIPELLAQMMEFVRNDAIALYRPPGGGKKRGWYSPRKSPMTNDDCKHHLSSKQPLGAYIFAQENLATGLVRAAVVDIDDHDEKLSWQAMCALGEDIYQKLRVQGLIPHAFRSGGGRGIHLWLFWGELQAATDVRAVLNAAVAEAQKSCHIDIFPKQDKVCSGEFGNLVALPFARRSRPIINLATGEVAEDLAGYIPAPLALSAPIRHSPVPGDAILPGTLATRGKKEKKKKYPPANPETVQEAIKFIKEANKFDRWTEVGMSLKHAAVSGQLEEAAAKKLWDEWSATAPNYDKQAIEHHWRTFPAEGDLTLGKIHYLAVEGGWTPRQFHLGKNGLGWNPVNDAGIPIKNYHNTRTAILRLGITCEQNLFKGRSEIGGHLLQEWVGEMSDEIITMLRQLILDTYDFDPGATHVRDAAQQLCLENCYDPVRDYLNGLQWDGVPRLDTWLQNYLAADSSMLTSKIGRLTLVAAVRRARHPGCKFDQMMVLEGKQGTGKSTAIAVLAGKDYFSDQGLLGMDEREQVQAMQGFWIHEIAELEGLNRGEVNRLKAYISRTEDRARPAYGRITQRFPRRCIFIGTTNDDQYLRDPTGNRRFWPVKTGEINLEGLRADRDQLWAEAAQAEVRDESIVLPPELWAEAAQEQLKRLEADLWEDYLILLRGNIVGDEERVSSADIMRHLQIPPDKQNSATGKRVKAAMLKLGWQYSDNIRCAPGGKNTSGYRRPVTEALPPARHADDEPYFDP